MKNGVHHHRVGDAFEGFLLVRSSTKGMASNGKPFLTLMLEDQSGEIEAKLWDCSTEDEQVYIAEKVIKISGEMTSFRGRSQLKIKAVRLAVSEDDITVKDLIQSAPLEVEEMADRITQYIFEMKNPNIQRITRQLVKKYQRPFFEYPAAVKNHHEYVSGLAYHVVSMLDLAGSLAKLYPSLDKDLLYAGVILHDLGKVIELSGPIAASYTFEGKMLGHISIMVNEISEAAKELEIEGEEVTILQHMILSHHGKSEWGSPKAPLIREAEILHMIDNMDAKMQMMNRALERTQPGEFSERVQPMEHRSFYKPTFHS